MSSEVDLHAVITIDDCNWSEATQFIYKFDMPTQLQALVIGALRDRIKKRHMHARFYLEIVINPKIPFVAIYEKNIKSKPQLPNVHYVPITAWNQFVARVRLVGTNGYMFV